MIAGQVRDLSSLIFPFPRKFAQDAYLVPLRCCGLVSVNRTGKSGQRFDNYKSGIKFNSQVQMVICKGRSADHIIDEPLSPRASSYLRAHYQIQSSYVAGNCSEDLILGGDRAHSSILSMLWTINRIANHDPKKHGLEASFMAFLHDIYELVPGIRCPGTFHFQQPCSHATPPITAPQGAPVGAN